MDPVKTDCRGRRVRPAFPVSTLPTLQSQAIRRAVELSATRHIEEDTKGVRHMTEAKLRRTCRLMVEHPTATSPARRRGAYVPIKDPSFLPEIDVAVAAAETTGRNRGSGSSFPLFYARPATAISSSPRRAARRNIPSGPCNILATPEVRVQAGRRKPKARPAPSPPPPTCDERAKLWKRHIEFGRPTRLPYEDRARDLCRGAEPGAARLCLPLPVGQAVTRKHTHSSTPLSSATPNLGHFRHVVPHAPIRSVALSVPRGMSAWLLAERARR